jgi:NAD(P)H-quinone oxidoreductase subunit 5
MPSFEQVSIALGLVVFASPLLLTFMMGISLLLDLKVAEEKTTKLIYVAIVSGLVSSVAILASMLLQGTRHIPIELGDWVELPLHANSSGPQHYHFSVKLVFDRLSVPFAILSFVLSGTIGAFASRYMHRERGFNRFFMLYAIFVLGMIVTSVAGTIETLFAGWELVGLSSALLVAFYQERLAPARNGLWIWVIYRVSDAGLLLAAVTMHHLRGEGDFDVILGSGSWPEETSFVSSQQALLVGTLLLVAAAGKSALIPFSGWLPRAMEGPTPSSAVFYGALSVHLGAFLLLRVSPLMERSLLLACGVVALGLATAVFAYISGSVQTDIKSALTFASLSQVGLIVTEIGLADVVGYLSAGAASADGHYWAKWIRYIALIHLLGHACLRTLQFLRAPTLLHDYHTLENAIGEHLPQGEAPLGRLSTKRTHGWLYRLALERGYLDAIMVRFVVAPFVRAFRFCDGLERRWTDFLAGKESRESDQVKPHFGSIEEFS